MTLITKKNIIIVLFGLIILLLPVIYWLNAGKNKTQTTELDNNKIIQNVSNYTDSTAPNYDTNIALYKIISVFPPDETQNIPDTMPEGAAEAERLFQRENHPDVYLANFTPYDSGSFSVQSEFLSDTNLFRFTVIQKTSAAKDDFTNWLKSLQLSDQQIGTLDISY